MLTIGLAKYPISAMHCKSSPLLTCPCGFVWRNGWPFIGALAVAATLTLSFLATGCSLTPLAKHTAAFSTAATLVINSSEDAYRGANQLRQDEQVAAAVSDYDKNPKWSPYTDTKPLLTTEQLNARITVLDGLKAYAASLVQITGSQSSKDLNTAAAGVGSNLKSLSSTVATDLKSSVPNAPVMSAVEANGVSTAVRALGDYLIARKVKGSLPKVTQDMNPIIKTLCELLDSDIVVLRRQADVDYQTLITDQDQFIRHPATPLDPVEHRNEIGKLISLAAQQKANDDLLAKLQVALHTLELTHQALAAAAQGNDTESIKQKIADLEAAGQSLASFYSSLPTK
jgi:hypothetical protein